MPRPSTICTISLIAGTTTSLWAGIFPGLTFLSDLTLNGGGDGTDGIVFNGPSEYHYLGFFVAAAGDINGDGIDDVIASAPYGYSYGYARQGRGYSYSNTAYVIFGRNDGGFNVEQSVASLDGTNGFTIEGNVYGPSVADVASAGDMNGDGFDDLIVGSTACFLGPENCDAAIATVIYGGPTIESTVQLDSLPPSRGFSIDDTGEVGLISVAGAGDINGDDLDDVIIGRVNLAGDTRAGFVIFGQDQATTSRTVTNTADLDGTNGFVITHVPNKPNGLAVAGAGDINGDGYDEVMIGPGDEYGGGHAVSVIFGAPDVGSTGTVDLTTLAPPVGFFIEGVYPADFAGRGLAGPGDVNGDGFDDMLVGAPYAYTYGDAPSRGGYTKYDYTYGGAYVIFGDANIGTTGFVNLGDLNGSNGFTMTAQRYGTGAEVAAAGDVNGDGFNDLVIGEYSYLVRQRGSMYEPKAFVVFGGPNVGGGDGVLPLEELEGSDGFQIQTGQPALYGGSIAAAGAGDINGDGVDDLIVGDRYGTVGGQYGAGQAFIIFGKRCAGDANGDNAVNFADLDIVLDRWNTTCNGPCQGDVNGNGAINFADLDIILDRWNTNCTPPDDPA